jgi:hemolysin III
MSEGRRPRYRGVSHAWAVAPALCAAGALVTFAPTSKAAIAAAVYGFGLVAMYAVSALYHRVMWSPIARQRMRRLDHGTIFLMIAGTGPPLFVLVGGEHAGTMLAGLWIGALAGVAQSLLQGKRPTWMVATPYVVVGWFGIFAMPGLWARFGWVPLGLFVLGGLVYTLGAVIYATRRPNPIPSVFGYHEVFHALVIVASVCHFAAIQHVVLRA